MFYVVQLFIEDYLLYKYSSPSETLCTLSLICSMLYNYWLKTCIIICWDYELDNYAYLYGFAIVSVLLQIIRKGHATIFCIFSPFSFFKSYCLTIEKQVVANQKTIWVSRSGLKIKFCLVSQSVLLAVLAKIAKPVAGDFSSSNGNVNHESQ
jgi:hypothetical protein